MRRGPGGVCGQSRCASSPGAGADSAPTLSLPVLQERKASVARSSH